ncbi:sensor histidine kinase [Macromonas nakdongensis]|uniref:sensor histidine kinase n=1 Tax=Macromonas nakdongensis TaxID=1843082 RepID=UPI000C336468|nr:histidine kinase [Macromonas nakdongensis]
MAQTAPSRLPNFRNLGVVLRALVLTQLLRLAYGWVQAPGWQVWWQSLLDAAPLYEPVTLSTVLLLYALAPWLERAAYRHAVAAVLALAGLVATAWHSALVHGMGLTLPDTVGHSASVAALVAGVVLCYFNWRHHRLSPALAQARMTALQARIRPHFLYNSLNSVLALLRSQPAQAEAMLHDLADLYRALLADARTLVPLQQELALARAYANIEQQRLGERLRLHWLCDHAPAQALVPPLLLQPLLENAVRHGAEPNPRGADVTLQAVADDSTLLLYVRNTLPPPEVPAQAPHSGNHLALDNIRERLALHFDAEASLRLRQEGGEYEVLVRLPLRLTS